MEHSTTVSPIFLISLSCHAFGILNISKNQKIGDSRNGSLGDWINLQSHSWIVKHQTASYLTTISAWKKKKKRYFFVCSFTGILLPIGFALQSNIWWYSQPGILSELLQQGKILTPIWELHLSPFCLCKPSLNVDPVQSLPDIAIVSALVNAKYPRDRRDPWPVWDNEVFCMVRSVRYLW